MTRFFGGVVEDLTCDKGRVGVIQKLKFRAVDVAFDGETYRACSRQRCLA